MPRHPWSAAVLALAVAAAVGLAQQPAEGKKVALLVGVQRYGDGTGLRNLEYPEKDVADLAAVLEKQGYRVTVLTRSEATKQDRDFLRPTARNVRDQLAAITKERKPEDTVLVAFSGHGAHLKATDQLYFCPQDTDLSDERSLVAIGDVMAALDGRGCKAGAKVLLVDACRNDPADGKSGGTPGGVKSVTRPLLPDPPGGTVALFSCSKGQISHESEKLKHGFLFHHVIEGLGGKAANKKTGEVTWLGLAAYVADELPGSVRREKGPTVVQTPEVRGDSRQLVLARAARAEPDPPSAPGPTGKPTRWVPVEGADAKVVAGVSDIYHKETGNGKKVGVGGGLKAGQIVRVKEVGESRCLVSWEFRQDAVEGWVDAAALGPPE